VNQANKLKPMLPWQSMLGFGMPTAFGIFGMYWLLPTLAKAGIPLFSNYLISMMSMFPLLICLSLIFLYIEQGSISWRLIQTRFRVRPLSRNDWKWTVVLLIVYVGGQILLLPTSTWLASTVHLPIPASLPPAINPRVPKAAIPTAFCGIALKGNWVMAVVYFIILIMNIVSEEFWWRGYILPRQEMQHGAYTWMIHGLLWTLFHAPFWWNFIALMPSTFSLSYVVSKTKNTTPGIIAHSVMNGLGFVMILLGVLGLG
jgi:membrane protease YdiL (CAAX protease family)